MNGGSRQGGSMWKGQASEADQKIVKAANIKD
jgi:hypothetical protein